MILQRNSALALLLGSTLGTVISGLFGRLSVEGLAIWLFFFILFLISKPNDPQEKK